MYDFTKSRAHLCREKLQQLNFYVKVTVLDKEEDILAWMEKQTDIKVCVLTDSYWINGQNLANLNQTCRKQNTAFISAFQNGLFGRVFNDFGPEFIVLDKDGEEL
jgi:ubiquitin-activating enzyme E1